MLLWHHWQSGQSATDPFAAGSPPQCQPAFNTPTPGSETIAHTHDGVEDFLILEGEVIESDGTRLQAGDFVSYPPGSQHNTRTETGCLLIGFDWGKEPKREPR